MTTRSTRVRHGATRARNLSSTTPKHLGDCNRSATPSSPVLPANRKPRKPQGFRGFFLSAPFSAAAGASPGGLVPLAPSGHRAAPPCPRRTRKLDRRSPRRSWATSIRSASRPSSSPGGILPAFRLVRSLFSQNELDTCLKLILLHEVLRAGGRSTLERIRSLTRFLDPDRVDGLVRSLREGGWLELRSPPSGAGSGAAAGRSPAHASSSHSARSCAAAGRRWSVSSP